MAESDWIYFVTFSIALIGIIAFSEYINKRLDFDSEKSRKIVHIVVGLFVAFTPIVFESMWPLIALGGIFAIIDYFAIHFDFLAGLHNTTRRTYGTVFYPLSFVLLTLLLWNHNKIILVISMLLMAIADAVAALIGQKFGKAITINEKLEKKSIIGSVTMFVSSFLIIISSLSVYPFLTSSASLPLIQRLWISLVVSIMATAFEVVSFRGSDNLTVPLGSAFMLHYMLTHKVADNAIFTTGMFLALIIAILSYKSRFLDKSGGVGVFILGTLVFGIGRWEFSIPILTFFVLSSFLSKFGKQKKQQLTTMLEKTGCRDIWQVLANGGIPLAILFLWYFYPMDILYLLYVGALTAVASDTWATEIGVLSKKNPRSILSGKYLETGESGGVTVLGTIGAFFGSLTIAAVALMSCPHSSPAIIGKPEFILLLLSGLMASFSDSVLGASLQAQYQCPICQKKTEKLKHCQCMDTKHIKGVPWLNNDMVNLLSAIFSVLMILIGWFVLLA